MLCCSSDHSHHLSCLQVYSYTLAQLTVCATAARLLVQQIIGKHPCLTTATLNLQCCHAKSGLQAPGESPSLGFAVPVAAGLAGIILSFVLSPFELVKVTAAESSLYAISMSCLILVM